MEGYAEGNGSNGVRGSIRPDETEENDDRKARQACLLLAPSFEAHRREMSRTRLDEHAAVLRAREHTP